MGEARQQRSGGIIDGVRRARGIARWAKENPQLLRDLALARLPGGARLPAATPSAAVGDWQPPGELAGYDQVVSVAAPVLTGVATTVDAVADLGLIARWLELHAGWPDGAPAGAAPGVTFRQQVRLMGIPAQVRWEVTRVDDAVLVLDGRGPSGVTLGIALSVLADGAGSVVHLDAGLGGDPVRGPMGASIARHVQQAMDASLTSLAALLAELREAGASPRGRAAAPVRHEATGTLLDPRTPVIVGAGQLALRTPDPSRDPVSLSVEALRRAAEDCGDPGILVRADAVYAVASASWSYRDQAAAVAAGVGATPRETVVSARFGGDAGQLLVNEAGQAIADGTSEVVLIAGAESGATLSAAQKQGATPTWPEQAADVAPTRTIGSDEPANNEAETSAGLTVPVYMYALMESAVRGRQGESIEEHQARITGLWSQLSQVAEANPHAWSRSSYTPQQLAEVDDDNRMISSPYPKLLCANLTVDLATGLVLTSVAAAQAAGIPQEKWVFLHAGAAAYDEWFVSERGDLAASPAIRTIGAAALQHAGLAIEDVAHVDLYSCFPAAVQIAAAELGLPVGDPDRPLSVTGGLTFAGGPGNNYGAHAIATLVGRLREDPTSYGLSTSLGWFVTKHALGIYAATPPRQPYRALRPVLDPEPSRRVLTDHVGTAVVEAYTVQYDRAGAPEAAIVSALTPDGARVLVRSRQPEVIETFTTDDPLGWTVEVEGRDRLTVLETKRADLPPPPEPPVLVERRGPVTVITLNRPHVRNAIDLATARLLEQVVDGYEADPDARVAVLTGAGGSFCSGMDLKAAASGQFPLTDGRGPLGITARPPTKPLIAAVEGPALAGGLELALCADLVVASTGSQFGIPEPKRGLVAAAGGVLRLGQRLPHHVAKELALTGDPMPAARMAELGLVNRLAEPGAVLDTALELAERIAANAPLSVALSKRILDESRDWTRAEEFERQTELAGPALFSEDAQEGMLAFVESRPPVWTGR